MDLVWKDSLHLLSQAPKKSEKCGVKILDTVFCDPKSSDLLWYFTTSKSKSIAKKKLSLSTAEAVRERFNMFSLANPNNVNRYVAVLVCGLNGIRESLQDDVLSDLVTRDISTLAKPGFYVQVFHSHSDSLLSQRILFTTDGGTENKISGSSLYQKSLSTGEMTIMELSNLDAEIIAQLRSIPNEISRFLMCSHEAVAKELEIEYVTDEYKQLWITAIPKLTAEKRQQVSVSPPKTSVLLEDPASKVLPLSSPEGHKEDESPLKRSNPNPLTSPTRSASTTPFSSPSPASTPYQSPLPIISSRRHSDHEAASLATPSSSSVSRTATPTQPAARTNAQEGLLRRDASGYSVSLGVDDLPGLTMWVLTKMAPADDELSWTVDFSQLPIVIAGDSPEDVDQREKMTKLRELRSSNRQVALFSLVAYIKEAESLLLQGASWAAWLADGSSGNPLSVSSSSCTVQMFTDAWQYCAKQIAKKYDASQLNSEVVVCGNTFSICQKIRSLIAVNFVVAKLPKSNSNSPTEKSKHATVPSVPVGPSSTQETIGESSRETPPFSTPTSSSKQAKPTPDQQSTSNRSSTIKQTKQSKQPGSKKVVAKKTPNKKNPPMPSAPPNANLMAKFMAEKEMESKMLELQKQEEVALRVKRINDTKLVKQREQEHAAFKIRAAEVSVPSFGSNVESEFVVRQAHIGEDVSYGDDAHESTIGQLSQYHDNGAKPPLVGSSSVSDLNGRDLAEKKIAGLKERLAAVELQLTNTTKQLNKSELALEEKQSTLRRVYGEMDTTKLSNQRYITQLREEHDAKMLHLRLEHSKEMGHHVRAEAVEGDFGSLPGSPSNKVNKQKSPSKESVKAKEGMKSLLDQIEQCRKENKKLQDDFDQERQLAKQEFAHRVGAAEKQAKLELNALRVSFASLEDKYLLQSDELRMARADLGSLEKLNKQAVENYAEALDSSNRLKADLKNMQKTTAASYKLEAAHGITVGLDVDSAIRLNDAKHEAKLRQSVNKVEYLKSQLTAEQQSTAANLHIIETNQCKYDELRHECKRLIQENEHSKGQAVAEAEARMDALYAGRMEELTGLQAKMAHLQGQLQETVEENIAARQKEEFSKDAIAKSQAVQINLRAEVDILKGQLQDSRDLIEDERTKNASQHSHDAMLRRLDNERNYLKSQLTSEITHKSELQIALQKCQNQLNEVQNQWKKDVETLKNTAAHDLKNAVENEKTQEHQLLQLTMEVERMSTSNKDLKDGYNAMRDQVRMGQLTMENMRTAERVTLEELENCREDITRLKDQVNQKELDHIEQTRLMRAAMDAVEAAKDAKIKQLADEKAQLYMLNSATQGEFLDAKKGFVGERQALQMVSNAARVYMMLNQWSIVRKGRYFRIWSRNNSLMSAAEQFRGAVGDMQAKVKDKSQADRLKTMEIIRQECAEAEKVRLTDLHQQFDETLALARRQDATALEEAVLKERANGTVELEASIALWQNNVKEAVEKCMEESDWMVKQKNIQLEDQKIRFGTEKEFLRNEYQTLLRDSVEDAVKKNTNKLQAEHLANSQEVEQVHEKLLKEYVTANRQEILKQKREAQRLLDDQKIELNAMFEKKMEFIGGDYTDQLEQQKVSLIDRREHDLSALKDTHMAALLALKEANRLEEEERLEQHKAQWDSSTQDAIRAKESEFRVIYAKKMEDFAKKCDGEKEKVIKMENSKWKQVMKESEKRHELEIKQSRDEGFDMRDQEAKIEIEKLTNIHASQSLAVKTENELYVLELKENLAKAATKFELDLLQMKEHTAASVEHETTEKLNREWTDNAALQVEQAWTEAAALSEVKIAKERDKLKLFQEETTRQVGYFATERSDLQAKIDQYEAALAENKITSDSTNAQLVADFEKEKARSLKLFEKQKEVALTAQAEKLANAQEVHIDQIEHRHSDHMQAYKKELDKEFNRQYDELNDENEKLVENLEVALKSLTQEKVALEGMLDSTSNKLEEAEDHLFDMTNAMKLKEKENSISTWRLLTGIQRMKHRFSSAIENFEAEKVKKIDLVHKTTLAQAYDMTLVCLKLSGVIGHAEEERQKMLTCLTTHGAAELQTKKMLLVQFEKDLVRMQIEKDALEERRDGKEEEIIELEQQITTLEDESREHNRVSTLQNGRVNVAHARKKRRLDAELERVLDVIEQRRSQLVDLDEKITDKVNERDAKEGAMIEIEKKLMNILLEQHRLVLDILEKSKSVEEQCKRVLEEGSANHGSFVCPWPPIHGPNMADVLHLFPVDPPSISKAFV